VTDVITSLGIDFAQHRVPEIESAQLALRVAIEHYIGLLGESYKEVAARARLQVEGDA